MKPTLLQRILPALILICLFSSCNTETPKTKPVKEEKATKEHAPVKQKKKVKDETSVIPSVLLDTLLALEIKDKESKEASTKYGYEFNGHCYNCDVADILVTKDEVRLINACGETGKSFKITKVSGTKNKTTLTCNNISFVLTQIDPIPVFELKVVGKLTPNKDLRINRFYSTSRSIKQFETFDCGDFDG